MEWMLTVVNLLFTVVNMKRMKTEVGELAVYEHGSGPATFFWPSLYVDARSLDALVAELAGARRCIVVDGPGHGGSSGPTPGSDLFTCARAAIQILDELGVEQVDWVGNAWGGHVGVIAAVEFPQRISSLAAIGSPMQPLEPKTRFLSRLLLVMLALGLDDTVGGLLAKAMLSPSADESLRAQVRESVKRATNLSGAVRGISLGRPDLVPLLRRVSCPTLFVAGADDAMWSPSQAAEHAARLPHGRAETLPGAAHLGPLERPRELAALLGAHLSGRADSSRGAA
jgi:pimeloyl-ACP methyl ester carboxylesterase